MRTLGCRRPGSRPVLLRVVQLVAGLFIFGVAISLMIRGGIGLGPWDAFHVGLSRLTGISVGAVIIAVGVAIVLANLAMKDRPGPATLANMVLIGLFVDALLPVVPEAPGAVWPWIYLAGGIGLTGLATGMYIGAGFGKGPRDGLMVTLSERTGWSVRRVRTVMEATVLVLGWLMGGGIGIGTLAFTLAIGPSAQWGLELFGVPAGGRQPRPSAPAAPRPRRPQRRKRPAAWSGARRVRPRPGR